MAAFPNYVRYLVDGYSEQPESALSRTAMESGPSKQAQIKSSVMVQVEVTLYFDSAANYQSFLAWFRTDIKYGALWFDWVDPRTGATRSARFVGGLERGKTKDINALLDQTEVPVTLEYWDA